METTETYRQSYPANRIGSNINTVGVRRPCSLQDEISVQPKDLKITWIQNPKVCFLHNITMHLSAYSLVLCVSVLARGL